MINDLSMRLREKTKVLLRKKLEESKNSYHEKIIQEIKELELRLENLRQILEALEK